MDKTGFQALSDRYFNSSANVSLYYTNDSSGAYIRNAVANVFSEETNFNIQFSSSKDASNMSNLFAFVSDYEGNYTFFPSYSIDGPWVNGTLAVGIGNYYHIQNFLDALPTTLNYTQLISRQIP